MRKAVPIGAAFFVMIKLVGIYYLDQLRITFDEDIQTCSEAES